MDAAFGPWGDAETSPAVGLCRLFSERCEAVTDSKSRARTCSAHQYSAECASKTNASSTIAAGLMRQSGTGIETAASVLNTATASTLSASVREKRFVGMIEHENAATVRQDKSAD